MARQPRFVPPSANLAKSPLHLIHRAAQCADAVFLEAIGSTKLTPRQYAVLHTIAHEAAPSQMEIVKRTGIDRSTLAEMMRRLTERDLVKRRRDRSDGRAYVVTLTDRGRAALNAATSAARTVDERILSTLPAERRAPFLEALEVLVLQLSPLRD